MTFLGAESRLPEVAPGLETEILPVGGGVDWPVGATAGGNPPSILTHVGIPDSSMSLQIITLLQTTAVRCRVLQCNGNCS